MNDKKIITQKEKNYIDTLELSTNLEDFIKDTPCLSINNIALDNYSIEGISAYRAMLSYLFDTMLCTTKKVSVAKGRTWYVLEKYTLGIMDYDKAKMTKQYNCVIEYNHSHIFPLNTNLDGLELPFGGTRSDYKIKRIDLTKTAKLETDYTINHGYISPYRNPPLLPNREKNTIYIGSRTNGNLFRMYPKTIELLEKKNYTKIALYSAHFGDIENLYSFELELRRDYLRDSLGIDTLAELPKVWKAHSNIVGKIRFFKDTPKNKKLLEQNHRDRIKALVLTDFVDYERVEKKRYEPSFKYAVDQIVKIADRYVETMNIEKNNDIYMKFANAFLSQRVSQENKDLVITFEDTVLSHETDEMTTKHKELRDNQSNDLEIEAKRHFGKFVSHKKDFVEIEVQKALF